MSRITALESRYRILGDYIPQALAWHRVSDALPQSDYDCIMPRSRDVLAFYATGRMAVAYVRYDDDPDFPDSPRWVQAGRDGYTGSKVTHWCWLPMPPSVFNNPRTTKGATDDA